MKIELTSPVEGKQPGETVDVAKDRAEWLLQNGYAKPADGDNDEKYGVLATSVERKADPTLAENREKPGEKVPGVDPDKNDEPIEEKTGEVVEEPKPTAKKTAAKKS